MTRCLLVLSFVFIVSSGLNSAQASFVWNGHTYDITPSDTWTNAEGYAVSQGGHLVTINDEAENEFIRTTFLSISGQQEDFWIGYYSPTGPSSDPSTYVWISGEPITYVNWRGGQPDLTYDYYTAINYLHNNDGSWDNYPDTWSRRGIYEIVPEPATLSLLLVGGLAFIRRRRKDVSYRIC